MRAGGQVRGWRQRKGAEERRRETLPRNSFRPFPNSILLECYLNVNIPGPESQLTSRKGHVNRGSIRDGLCEHCWGIQRYVPDSLYTK